MRQVSFGFFATKLLNLLASVTLITAWSKQGDLNVSAVAELIRTAAKARRHRGAIELPRVDDVMPGINRYAEMQPGPGAHSESSGLPH